MGNPPNMNKFLLKFKTEILKIKPLMIKMKIRKIKVQFTKNNKGKT